METFEVMWFETTAALVDIKVDLSHFFFSDQPQVLKLEEWCKFLKRMCDACFKNTREIFTFVSRGNASFGEWFLAFKILNYKDDGMS